jgi:3'(2'), 5'-bisphosphate nucleotidase
VIDSKEFQYNSCSPALMAAVCKLAKEAGKAILEIYDSDYDIQQKGDHTPLTEADLAAHYVIVAGLEALTPDIPVLSEESEAIPFEERQRWQRYWLVDPLDGTVEFIRRNGEFSVNIALIDQQKPVQGIIHAPVTGVTYYACHQGGAFKQERDQEPVAIQTRRCDMDRLTVVCSNAKPGKKLQGLLDKLGKYERINYGSSLKSCLVAEGRADLYARLGPTSEWDTAAAQCIVEQAGGHITDTTMQALSYNTKDSLLNPEFFVAGDRSIDWSRYL